MAKLTPKQQRFVDEYLIDLNATQAAIRAGYKEKRAYSTGHENLKKPEIQTAIATARLELSERTSVTQDIVVEGLLEEARFKGDGTTHGARVKAWEVLGKYLGMFDRKAEDAGNGLGREILKAIADRLPD